MPYNQQGLTSHDEERKKRGPTHVRKQRQQGKIGKLAGSPQMSVAQRQEMRWHSRGGGDLCLPCPCPVCVKARGVGPLHCMEPCSRKTCATIPCRTSAYPITVFGGARLASNFCYPLSSHSNSPHPLATAICLAAPDQPCRPVWQRTGRAPQKSPHWRDRIC